MDRPFWWQAALIQEPRHCELTIVLAAAADRPEEALVHVKLTDAVTGQLMGAGVKTSSLVKRQEILDELQQALDVMLQLVAPEPF